MKLELAGKRGLRIEGCMIDSSMMNRLAKIIWTNVRLSFSSPIHFTVAGGVTISSVKSESRSKKDIFGKFLPESIGQQDREKPKASFWRRPLYFGMSHVGDVVVLYIDGVTEAVSQSLEKSRRELFGEERLIEVVQANAAKSAREIESAILGAISNYTTNAPQDDDITLVIIKRQEQSRPIK